MNIRPYQSTDLSALLALFYETIHTSCAADYTPAQLDAWAPLEPDVPRWADRFSQEIVLVAEEAGTPLGFASLEGAVFDLLYVRPDVQRQGVATVLCDFLERLCPAPCITVHASKTARSFCEQRGYRVLRDQQVERRGQRLVNYVMEKELI